MIPIRTFSLAAALLVAGQAFAADGAVVTVDAATQKRIGIATAPLAAARRSATVNGFARVLDPVPLAILDTDLQAAVASASASAAEAQRAQALFAADATVSAKAAQAAQAQAHADASRVRLLRLRLGLEWGPAFARMSDAARSRLINAVSVGQAALLRIDISGPTPLGIASADIQLSPGQTVRATVLGPARTGDPRLQSTGLLAQVSGPAAARLGSGLTAPVSLAAGQAATGVVLPRSAVLRTGGQSVVYIKKSPTTFERRAAVNAASQADGLFAPSGFAPSEAVVIQGAQALYAAQNPPAAEE
jgi:hypothetical protein